MPADTIHVEPTLQTGAGLEIGSRVPNRRDSQISGGVLAVTISPYGSARKEKSIWIGTEGKIHMDRHGREKKEGPGSPGPSFLVVDAS
jgi:hypothetical protein